MDIMLEESLETHLDKSSRIEWFVFFVLLAKPINEINVRQTSIEESVQINIRCFGKFRIKIASVGQ